MFTKRSLSLTITIQIICWSIIALLLLGENEKTAHAVPFYQVATPELFLGPIYYGQEDVWQIFDHRYPLLAGNDGNNFVIHYDGVQYNPPFPDGYGYDGHIGIDYSLVYEPVLAGATGAVHYAGWSNPANHRTGYGLYVKMNHTVNADYRTWYGHFSTLVVKTGETITAPYDDRQRILGISGNTGYVFGSNGTCGDVNTDPLCGAHLHFEVRQINVNRPVNPYGWIGLAGTPDPWANYVAEATPPATPVPLGATSHDLWANPLAVIPDETDQYPGGTPVTEPPVNDYLIEVDDSDATLFSSFGDCWIDQNSAAGVNGGYDYSLANTPGSSGPCYVQWSFDPSAFAPAGEYDIYVHIPDPATSLSAEYTIFRQGQIDTAIVVQAAFPNEAHDNWAYIGRYHFNMNGSDEYIRLNNQNLVTMTEDTGHVLIADAIRLMLWTRFLI